MLGKSLTLPALNGAPGESPPGADLASKQALIANEKRRRRRESHNAVERRRRDNINEKISELATLIPECLLDPNGASDLCALRLCEEANLRLCVFLVLMCPRLLGRQRR
ncbi:uncharacterized protein B0H18DRAFT_987404 [Fomitopsis serialis]|uniref:uncharacterized protein n=1 Tax=Fomitopsis serialis TaxID=139415 RepID=UPI0020077A73|nr:uncharacterized protein B0H18DRAFT_987404 [Neoantrodia serialis]KAH9932281.1 hypothetical protein B0H18DRAFT_987404 [Neoantrodia serialis]